MSSTDNVKVTVNIPRNDLEDLQRMAEQRGISMTAAIRESIQCNVMLWNQEQAGWEIGLMDANGKVKKRLERQ